MKKNHLISSGFLVAAFFIIACGGGNSHPNTGTTATTSANEPAKAASTDAYDPTRGEGKFDESNVKIAALDAGMAEKGKAIVGTKCSSCHKLTDEKLVGPGWKGVTERHKPWWIMNFITNPDPMIDKDPKAQAQLELCLVRMPNQNLSDDDARFILEFMRKNDGAK